MELETRATTIALDPDQTVTVELPGYAARPTEARPRLVARHFTCRTGLELDRLLRAAAEAAADGRGAVDPLLAQAVALLVTDWQGLGPPCPRDPAARAEALLDALTPLELAEVPGVLLQALQLAESARKKSAAPSPGAAAPGAATAGA